MSQVISDLLGTLEPVFRVARAAFNATGLTAPRTFTLPDVSGTVFTSGNLLNVGTTLATARTAIGVTPGVDVVANNNAGVNTLGMSWTSGNIRVTVNGVPSTLWHAGNSAQILNGTADGQYARWNHTAGRYEAVDVAPGATTMSATMARVSLGF